MTKIDDGLALALAAQVSLGLTPGEGQYGRMYGALTAIGLMLGNATEDLHVHDQLDLIGNAVVTEHGDGVTRVEMKLDPPPLDNPPDVVDIEPGDCAPD
jgi:hypothetical protein